MTPGTGVAKPDKLARLEPHRDRSRCGYRDLGTREEKDYGTAFGPDSVRTREVSVAVSLRDRHLGRVLHAGREWQLPKSLPAKRRSGFYIELAPTQLWSGLADNAFESLKVARHIAPQHTREHPWAREDADTLHRLKRAASDTLRNFAEWCAAN